MWVVHIILNIFYSLEFDENWTSKKIMGFISEILVKVTNSYIFQRAVTLLIFIQSLPNLACDLQLSLASIIGLWHIYKYGRIRRYTFIVRNNGGHLGFFKFRSGYEMSTCQNIEALCILNQIQPSNFATLSVYTGLYWRSSTMS